MRDVYPVRPVVYISIGRAMDKKK